MRRFKRRYALLSFRGDPQAARGALERWISTFEASRGPRHVAMKVIEASQGYLILRCDHRSLTGVLRRLQGEKVGEFLLEPRRVSGSLRALRRSIRGATTG